MARKNWFKQLTELEGAVTEAVNPFNFGIQSSSPSADFIYGNGTWLLPFGYSEVLYGPPKGGKSVFVKMKIGQLHKQDPEAIAVVFDTEYRWRAQLTPDNAASYGIDLNRLVVYETNNPVLIFDRIVDELAAMIDDGCPIRYLVIDSVSGILGRREMNSKSVETQQIGDHALTVGTGLKRIIGTIRNKKLATSVVTQIRAELDMGEQMRGNKVKMNASFGLQHFAEYFVYIEPNRSKEGKTDLLGAEFRDDSVTDLMDKGEKTAHKIRVTMKDSSMGPKGRTGEFTFDYHKGIINVHEEVFRLGVNRGVITRPGGAWLEYDGKKYQGKKDMLAALAASSEMQAKIIRELKERDLRGDYRAADAAAAEQVEAIELD